jgi:UDP-glucose 4-epimerase
MKKVLITGANGFLGNYILEHFRINGFEVKGWVRTCKGGENQFVSQVDMLDSTAVEEALAKFEPDIVIHCAGSANVNLSVSNPEHDFNGNVKLTHNLLFSLKKMELMKTRVVFLSSAAVYGNPASLPISEDAQLNPLSPYALHKVMCENICHYFAENYGMDIKIARIFSAYGIGLKKQIFWDMYQKAKRTGFLEMFGTGLESRDYINVKDAVYAIYLLANKAPKEEIFFNVANGCEITIKEATATFANFYGIPKKKISFIGKVGEGHPTGWQADITKIKELGYNKTVSFDQGIKEYVNWVMERSV